MEYKDYRGFTTVKYYWNLLFQIQFLKISDSVPYFVGFQTMQILDI